MELFWTRGYEATGITNLLEHMGIPRQSLYNTFGSKEEVLLESLDLYVTNLHQIMRDLFEGSPTPFEKIDLLFSMWEEQIKSNGCFLGNCVAEFGLTHDKVARKMTSRLQSVLRAYRDIFQEAIDRGDLPTDRSAQTMATTLMTYAQGLALIKKTTTDSNQIHGTIETMKQSLKR